jgi:hypothetical protein
MTLSMQLRWKSPDASTLVNLRLKDVAAKGFLPFEPGSTTALGAEITPVPLVLQVTVSPFVLSNFDGAVVISDAVSSPLTVSDGQINYVVCRARYRLMDSPVLQLQVMTQAAYLADPELDWLHVIGVVDLSVGGPYTSVPTTRIFYENRHAVDQQTRSSWKEPVATSGNLPVPPADHNRHGDVRLVTSTGSLYWWNDSGSIWEVFDEVPLITHRDHEHTNGITSDSAAGTLLPGVSGAGAAQAMDIAAVGAGSAYTVNGRLLQTPAFLTSILASTVGASRGLIRVEIDDTGTLAASYRAYSGTNNIDYARIVNMSDAHPAGAFVLDFTFVGSTLTWDNGPPVAVVVAPSGVRRHRLYRPNGIDWIEIEVYTAPAAPGANFNDIYTVNAPTDFETKLLVAYWYWNGTGTAPLIVGEDKRRFGNLSFSQMGTEFKDTQFYPPMTELRGNMVYSGGTCSTISGLNLRITGPIVSYIQGKRFETPGYYNGLAFPASTTRYVYVDDQGVLQVQAVDPATVFDGDGNAIQFAEVARIVTSGVTFTLIEDRRDPQLVVGNATRDSRLKFTGSAHARWKQANLRLVVENNGSTVNVGIETGRLRLGDNFIEGLDAGPLYLADGNTVTTQALTAVGEADLSIMQPLNPTPSLFGVIHDLQRANRYVYGVETGCTPSIGAGTSVDIAAGSFFDALGRRVTLTTPVNVPITSPVANNVYAIAWDPDASGSGAFKTVNISLLDGCDAQDLPFAVAVLNGTATAVSLLENAVRKGAVGSDRTYVTVGTSASVLGANFSTIRSAMLHIMCFDDGATAPREIRIVSAVNEPHTAAEGAAIKITNATGFPWARYSSFHGLRIVGYTLGYLGKAELSWDASSGPLIDFNTSASGVTGFSIEGVLFYHVGGTALATDHARSLFRNVGRGFQMADCSVYGIFNTLSHVVSWTDSVVNLGGNAGNPAQDNGTVFERVTVINAIESGSDGLFYFGDATGTNNSQVTEVDGLLTFINCTFECAATDIADSFIYTDAEADTNTAALVVTVRDSLINRVSAVFNNCRNASKLFDGGTLMNISTSFALSADADYLGSITGVRFSGTAVNLTGVGSVTQCTQDSGCTVTLAATNRLDGCLLNTNIVTGAVGSISNSVINLGLTGVLTAGAPSSSGDYEPSISNSVIQKSNDSINSNTMLQLTSTMSRCMVSNTVFVYLNSSITATQPVISVTGSLAKLRLKGCTIDTEGERTSMSYAITATATSAFQIGIEDCFLDVALGLLQVSRVAGSSSGEVHIVNNNLNSDGSSIAVIDIQNSTSGQLESIQFSDNKFNLTGFSPLMNIFHGKYTTFTGNHVVHTDGDATYLFGGTTTTDGRQDSLSITGNTFAGKTGADSLDITLHSFKSMIFSDNTWSVEDAPGTSTCWLTCTGQSTFSRSSIVTGNSIACDATTGIASPRITISGFADIVCCNNDLWADSAGGNVTALLIAGGGAPTRKVSLSNNTSVAVTTGTGNASTGCFAAGEAVGEGEITVSGNVMEATNGGSGSGTVAVTVDVSDSMSASIIGNSMRGRQDGTDCDVAINVAGSGFVAISGNSLRSSEVASINSLTTNTDVVAAGNVVQAEGGDADMAIWASVNATATGNSVRAFGGSALVEAGDYTTTLFNAVASGNNCSGSVNAVVIAHCVESAATTGNALRAGSDAYASAGTSRTGGSAASVSSNTIRCGGTGALTCTSTTGTNHLHAIKDNVVDAASATAFIGSNALRGAVQGNISTGALSITNSATNAYTGGNNANT